MSLPVDVVLCYFAQERSHPVLLISASAAVPVSLTGQRNRVWENGETFRKTDIMENCCDVALYPLGLEPFERPVGLQLSSHLSDKEADSGRVLPDVMFICFRLCHNHLLPLPQAHTLLFYYFFWTLAEYRMGKANDVTSSCFISSGHGGKQQSLYSCVQALPLSGSTMWGFQQSDGKHKSKAYVYSTPETWKTASHAVCVAGHTWRQTACAQCVDAQKTVQMLQMSLKLLIIWNPGHLPLAQFGVSVVCKAQQTGSSVCWSQSPTVKSEQKTPVFTRTQRFGVHESGFFIAVFFFVLLTVNWGRIRVPMAHGAASIVVDAWEAGLYRPEKCFIRKTSAVDIFYYWSPGEN